MITRRHALRGAAGAAALRLLPGGVVAGAAFAAPAARAADWPKPAFDATTSKEALKHLYQDRAVQASDAVQLTIPQIAENGTVVPVTITTTLTGAQTVALIAEGNPRALIAQHTFGPRAVGPLSVRVRLAKSQNVVAIVGTADGKLHSAAREVTVTVGGCGG